MKPPGSLILMGALTRLCLMGCANQSPPDSSLALGNIQDLPADAPLVCLGDSLTAGHGATAPGEDDPANSYPAYLQHKISIPVINAGVSGDTSGAALARLQAGVLVHNPRIVVIELGANDLFQRVAWQTTQDNLKKIIEALDNGERKLYLAKFYTEAVARDMLDGIVQDAGIQGWIIAQYDAMYRSLASAHRVEIIEDIWSGIWRAHMSDTIHPNAAGYAIMAERCFTALEPYLREQGLLK
ncbi:MAG: GDSL-type esterase/lipase family protein [Treponema sp.]|nr:GDSL-type esterase/lipase family protein [Treponema sp.]